LERFRIEDYYLGFRTKSIAGGKNGIFSTFEDGFETVENPKFLSLKQIWNNDTW